MPNLTAKILCDVTEQDQFMQNVLENLLCENVPCFFKEKNYLLNELSNLQTHLRQGSKENTSWISFSKSLYVLRKYYLQQKKHAVVVTKSKIEGILDLFNDKYHIVYDLSSQERIYEVKDLLFNRLQSFGNVNFSTRTHLRSVGFQYAIFSKVYYNYVSVERVIAMLGPLEVSMESLIWRIMRKKETLYIFFMINLYMI